MASNSSDNKSKAASIGKFWGKAKEEAKSGSFSEAVPLEPGKYNQQLVMASIGTFGDARQIMTKWVVTDSGDDRGTVCTMWSSLAEDRIVWTVRLLTGLGVNVDDTDIEDEDDLMNVFIGLIADNVVAKTSVRLKDGYVNMYVNSVAEVANDDLFDPEAVAAAIKSGNSSKDSKKDTKEGKSDKEEKPKGGGKDEAGDDEVTISEGDRVKWKDGKKEVEGEIVAFDKDDNAIVRPDGSKKTVTLKLEKLEKLEKVEAEGEGEKEEEEVEEPKKGGKSNKPEPKEEEKKVVEEGDVVIVKYKGKDKSGLVDKLKGNFAYVDIKGVDELVKVAVDEVKFAVD